MSEIHYFQRFSSKENVATNNTLLLLRRLYQYGPSKFEGFLEQLIGGQSITVGPRFEQQVGGHNKHSIPDGSIRQPSFRVLIETKLNENITIDQIGRHLDHFENEEVQVMLTISPSQLKEKRRQELQVLVTAHNQKKDRRIALVTATFEEIVREMYSAINADRDFEMIEIVEDYERFCEISSLLPRDKDKLRAIVAGQSFVECLEYDVYYTLAERGYNSHTYIGLYLDKSVRAIGKIEKIVEADLDATTNQLVFEGVPVAVTVDQERRIREVIRIGMARGWGVNKGHRFFLVEKFHETDFQKISSGGLWGTKYFHLEDCFREYFATHHELPSLEDMAMGLKGKTWS